MGKPDRYGGPGAEAKEHSSLVSTFFYLENIFVFLCAFPFPIFISRAAALRRGSGSGDLCRLFMLASAELALGAVHGHSGLSWAAASVSGNLGASIKPVLTGPREPWETAHRTRLVLHQGHGPNRQCQACRAAGSPRVALLGGSLAARGCTCVAVQPRSLPRSLPGNCGLQWEAPSQKGSTISWPRRWPVCRAWGIMGHLEHRRGLTVSQRGLLTCQQPRWHTGL